MFQLDSCSDIEEGNINPRHLLEDWKTKIKDTKALQTFKNYLCERRRTNEKNSSTLSYEIHRQWHECIEWLETKKNDLIESLTAATERCNAQLYVAEKLIEGHQRIMEFDKGNEAKILESERKVRCLFNTEENYEFRSAMLQEITLQFELQNLSQIWDLSIHTGNISNEEKESSKASESKPELEQKKVSTSQVVEKANVETPKGAALEPIKAPEKELQPSSVQKTKEISPSSSSVAVESETEIEPNQELNHWINFMDDSVLQGLLSIIKEELWCSLSGSIRLPSFKSKTPSDPSNKILNDYITKDGTLDLSNGKYSELTSPQKEQLQYGLQLQQYIALSTNRKKFPRLVPILKKIETVNLCNNGKNLALEDLQWIGSIVSSRYCLIGAIAVDTVTDLTADCLKKIGEICRYNNTSNGPKNGTNHSGSAPSSTAEETKDSPIPHLNIFCKIDNPKTLSIREIRIQRGHKLPKGI